MSITKPIGGERLGTGNKMNVTMKGYERSTHDLGYIWRSTMAPGTLTPFMTELGLPGDTFDIDLDCNIMTHPTVGPLFGSYKVQLDVFMTPIRLYQAKLHNNKLGIGLNMAQIHLPLIEIEGRATTDAEAATGKDQINPSCIFSFLNMRGLGRIGTTYGRRQFNAVPFLGYWDIYKNYYANKQEEIGAVIHNEIILSPESVTSIVFTDANNPGGIGFGIAPAELNVDVVNPAVLTMLYNPIMGAPLPSQLILHTDTGDFTFEDVFETITPTTDGLTFSDPYFTGVWINWRYAEPNTDTTPTVQTFPLENIDAMREDILAKVALTVPYVLDEESLSPFGLPMQWNGDGAERKYVKETALEGLALKTYQSDLFNNWLQTEWLDGTNGINEITAIDTTGGSFQIDQLNLQKKVYDMLNRIALSGGTYKDWIDTNWDADTKWNAETPMYMGGLIKELVFQEVVSNSESGEGANAQPLGTLAGRGVMSRKHKGGKIRIRVTEPSYIQGIISLTPRLDYSQGNKWDVNLKTMDDLHKPALDGIGFQDLITDQMAWWDTLLMTETLTTYSAGKQPAWINYMTNVNQVRGNFAIEGNEMFMTLNRKYEPDATTGRIKDLTTYIDPIKFNDIFAQTSRDAQNFWTQIGVDITARRKMSAKIIPNL